MYVPSIRRDVLDMIIGKLLKLDVSVATLYYNNPKPEVVIILSLVKFVSHFWDSGLKHILN